MLMFVIDPSWMFKQVCPVHEIHIHLRKQYKQICQASGSMTYGKCLDGDRSLYSTA